MIPAAQEVFFKDMETQKSGREAMVESAARNESTEKEMSPRPVAEDWSYKAAGKLEGKTALITGGDSGIGRATAILFAREGADVAIVYHSKDTDAAETLERVQAEGGQCLSFKGDVGDESFCRRVVEETARTFGRLDILVNNAAEQHPKESLEEITSEQLEKTFRTNIFGYFFMAKAESFGKSVPMGRPGQPEEVAPCFVFLASDDSSYITGQFLHPNGGEVVNA